MAVLGPWPLRQLTRAGLAPRLGVAVWLAAIGSVVVSWIATAAVLAGQVVTDARQPGHTVLGSCFAVLLRVAGGRDGALPQVALAALATAAGAAVARMAWRLGKSLLRARSATHRHARMARMVGRPVAGRDAVVLDAAERVVYCVAGRPHTIVVTSATLAVLDERHLDAVLTHERAHLAGRHHLLMAFTRALAAILPTVPLFTTGAAEIARLLEMCADDSAARMHGRATLLDALVLLCDGAPIPTGALGATSVSVQARAQRLAGPFDCGPWMRLLLATTAVALLVAPALIGVQAAAGLSWCG